MTAASPRIVEVGIAVMLVCAPVSISGTQAGLAIAVVGGLAGGRRAAPALRTPLDAPILALLGVSLVSALLSPDPVTSLRRFTASWTILAFYVVVGWLRGAERTERFLLLLLPSAVALGAYGIVQNFTGLNVLRAGGAIHSLSLAGRQVFLPRGGFSHYQTFANVFFVIFCLSCGLAAATTGRQRALRAAVAAFLGVVVVFTFTRGIWISLLAAVAILAWVLVRRSTFVVVGAAALVVLAVLAAPSSLRTRARSMADLGTNVERLLLWETAWNMVRDRPVLGVGVGNFRAALDGYVRDEVPLAMTRTHAHNVWLQAAVERGVLGALALLWLVTALFATAVRALRRRAPGRKARALAAGACAAIAGFFIDGMVQNNLGDSQAALLLWLAAGVLVASARDTAAPASPAGAPA